MAPTSDERREVAARLRDCIVYAKKHDLNGDCDMGSDKCVETRNTLYNDIASCIEEYGNFNLSAEQVFTRLADLIDPTCHIVCVDDTYNTPETGHVDEWHYECSKCGIELDDNDTDAMDSGAKPFDYCPNCGARVVSDDD